MAFRGARGCGLAAVEAGGDARGLTEGEPGFPAHLDALIAAGPDALWAAYNALYGGGLVDQAAVEVLPPFARPGKIICVGLNSSDYSAESGLKQPDYPTLFGRFTTIMIGHGAPMIRPRASEQLDYEGELVAVVGQSGRSIRKRAASSTTNSQGSPSR